MDEHITVTSMIHAHGPVRRAAVSVYNGTTALDIDLPWTSSLTVFFNAEPADVLRSLRTIRDACDAFIRQEEDKAIADADAALAAHRLQVDEAEGEAYPADQPIGLPRSATTLFERVTSTPPVEVGTPEAQALVAGLDAIGQALELPAPDKPDTLEPAA